MSIMENVYPRNKSVKYLYVYRRHAVNTVIRGEQRPRAFSFV